MVLVVADVGSSSYGACSLKGSSVSSTLIPKSNAHVKFSTQALLQLLS